MLLLPGFKRRVPHESRYLTFLPATGYFQDGDVLVAMRDRCEHFDFDKRRQRQNMGNSVVKTVGEETDWQIV